jgi:ribosomal protein S18 acetylase RimI-like enzyme
MTETDGAHTRFRVGEPLDLPAIYALERQYMADIEPDGLEGWVRATDRNLRVWIENLERTVVAEDDGQLIGYQMWTPQDGTATLITINVVEARRRRGLGRQLLDRFVHDARTAGHDTLKLGVHENNPARTLYEKAGFQQVATTGSYLLYELR